MGNISQPSFEIKKVPLQQSVLVIGGGIAGLSVAQEIHHCGYATTIVEQTDQSGGQIFPDLSAEGIEVFSKSSLLEFTGNIGDFFARINTPAGEKTVRCGVVILASGTPGLSIELSNILEIAGQSGSAHIFSIFDVELAIADLVKRKNVRSIGLILDMERDETKASTEMALKLAQNIQHQKRYQASLFCRDVHVAAKDLERLYDDVREAGVNIIKYDGQIVLTETEKGVVITYADSILRQEMTVYCDRVGVSPFGLAVPADTGLAEMFGISTDAYGQMQANNIHLFPAQTNRPGIFVVGSCRGQPYLPQIMTEAKAVALEVHALLSQKSLEVELSNAVVDADKCVLCLTCIRSCPHKAMQINRTKGAAESIPEVCQKCGICAGECPAKAIELPRYSDNILIALV
jgi:heterodisulfide reductase subunit A